MTPLDITSRTARPYILLITALVAATFAAVFMKLAQDAGLPSPIVATGRLFLSAVLLTPLIIARHRTELQKLTRRDLLFAMFAGFWIAVHFLTMVYALEYTSVMILQVIVNTGPIWVALLEVTFLKEKLNREVWLGILVTIIGGSVIALASSSAGGNSTLFGNFLALLGSIAGSIYITIGRSVRSKVSLFPYIWIVFGIGAIISSLFVLVSRTPVLGHPTEAYFWLVMLTLIPQLIGHAGFNYALGYFSATMVSLTSQVLTVTAGVAAFLIFAEVPTSGDILGSVIIVGGVILALIGKRRKAKS